LELIKKLREETGVAIIRIREVLEEVGGDEKKALVILKKEGVEKAAKREGRVTGQGKVFVYSHHTGKIVGVVELLCETDFVAKTDVFETLGKDIAMQIASMGDENLLEQEFIKDPGKTVSGLIKEAIAKTGENIRVGRVFRVELGR
jgi:elongation factor Ts